MDWERLPMAPLYADVWAYCSHVKIYCKRACLLSSHPRLFTLHSFIICDAVTKKRTGIIILTAFLALPFLKLNFRKRVNLSSNHWLEGPMENYERFMNVHVGVCACFLQVWTTWFLSLLESFSSPLKFMWRLVNTCFFFFLLGKC